MRVIRYQTVIRMIDAMSTDLMTNLAGELERNTIRSVDDVRQAGRVLALLRFRDGSRRSTKSSRVMRDRLYRHYRVSRMTEKAGRVLAALFKTYMTEPRQMPEHVVIRAERHGEPISRAVADYIAGMTDRFALDQNIASSSIPMSASDKPIPSRLKIACTAIVGDPARRSCRRSRGTRVSRSPETNGDAVLERIREYLGHKLKLVKAEVSHDEITVEIEFRGWTEEGTRMASVARDLYEKGARRSALSMYRDALDLDPLNAEAMLRLGLALAEQEKFADALAALKHAASSAPAASSCWSRWLDARPVSIEPRAQLRTMKMRSRSSRAISSRAAHWLRWVTNPRRLPKNQPLYGAAAIS